MIGLRGFTLDSSTRQEYLQKLSTLETYPRLSAEQVELAERFAYGVFLCRELSLERVARIWTNGMDTTRFAVPLQNATTVAGCTGRATACQLAC